MTIISSVILIILNLIMYVCFGSLILRRKNKELSLGMCLIVGYFVYYIVFFLVCMPYMIKYRPLSWLTRTWIPVALAAAVISLLVCRRELFSAIVRIVTILKENISVSAIVIAVTLIQVIIVSTTYNFTLDAAYYVANVSTSLQTNMINVYDPFTGNWQNHYEIRYFFATYSINDAVMCQFFKQEALIYTKIVMSSVVAIIVNVLYVLIADYLFKGNKKAVAIMLTSMLFVNLTFSTIFTPSYFLMTRTYEGKTIIGNLAVPVIFYIYMRMINDDEMHLPWLSTFLVSVGAITISSSANMVLPAELCLLYFPYMVMKKTAKPLPKLVMCILPGIIMLITYVLYIEGYFVLYTYPTKVS